MIDQRRTRKNYNKITDVRLKRRDAAVINRYLVLTIKGYKLKTSIQGADVIQSTFTLTSVPNKPLTN